jgi:ribosomal protein S18 acetylase RimI-like enzyme
MGVSAAVRVTRLSSNTETIAALSEILIEVVANGGSVSFMHPLAPEAAANFWAMSLSAADAGRRVVLGATIDGELAATVTLDLDTPPNQPHRADIAKLMTRMRHRGRGVARTLMLEAERIAVADGRTLLTLDTAAEDGAAGLYEGLGFDFAGAIPGYALKPLGGLTATLLYFKRIGAAALS